MGDIEFQVTQLRITSLRSCIYIFLKYRIAVASLRHPVNPQCKSIKPLALTKVHFVAFMLFHSCAISSELNLYNTTKVHFVAFMLFHSCAISSKLESLILEITKPQLSLRLMFSFLVGKTVYERH